MNGKPQYVCGLAIALYLLSLSLPGIVYQPTPVAATDFGYYLLLVGAWGIFSNTFAWFANFWVLLAIFCSTVRTVRASVAAMILSMLAFLTGLNSYEFTQKYLDESGNNVLRVDYLGIGFYIWELSFLVLATYFCLIVLAERRSAATSQASPDESVARS
jgi:hypothetical protein